MTLNLTSIALSPRSTTLSVPSINLPENCIDSEVVGRDPTLTSTKRPFDPDSRLSAPCNVDWLISITSESMVRTPLEAVKLGV